MSAFTLDIRGQLNNMRLAESKALWPLFEAVVNSIQAIEDSPNSNQGKVYISAVRDSVYQGTVDTGHEALEKFESFIITDNGIGMDSEALAQIKSTLYSGTDSGKVGLRNIANRITYAYGKDSFSIQSVKNFGTMITLRFPYEELNHQI